MADSITTIADIPAGTKLDQEGLDALRREFLVLKRPLTAKEATKLIRRIKRKLP